MSECHVCHNGKTLGRGWRCDVCGRTNWSELASPTGSASVLHIWYRRENGEAVGLQVGGIASDDAIHAIRAALDEGAVAVTIIRETVRMQNR
jgi:hypothetical protein